MKTLALLTLMILSTAAQAGTFYLAPDGRAVNIGGHTVICGGAAQPQESKFQCACFAPDSRGTNLGMVWGIWAADQRDAEYKARYRCHQQYRQPVGSVSCSPQLF